MNKTVSKFLFAAIIYVLWNNNLSVVYFLLYAYE